MISEPVKEHIDPRVIRKLWILGIKLLIMSGMLLFSIAEDYGNLPFAVMGLVIGYVPGRYVFVRTRKFEWDESSLKLIMKLDWLGGIVLVLSVLIKVFQKWLFGIWVPTSFLHATTLGFATGLIIGRLAGTRNQIKSIVKVLKDDYQNKRAQNNR